MGAIDDFIDLMRRRDQKTKDEIPATLVWATVDSVDWENKQMDVTGIMDGLAYYKVLLGLGNLYRRPAVGSKVLLGILEKQESAAVLVDGEHIEELVYMSGESEFTIKEDGYIVKQGNESLKTILNDFMDECNKIIVVNGTTINVAAVNQIKGRLNQVLIA